MSRSTSSPSCNNLSLFLPACSVLVVALLCTLSIQQYYWETCQFASFLVAWSLAQWLPLSLGQPLQEAAWNHWSTAAASAITLDNSTLSSHRLDIPVIHIQDHHPNDLLVYLESTYGKDWRKRPLLLKGLWPRSELEKNHSRRLSLSGLLNESLTIPYFRDARQANALTPDDRAPIQDIVAKIVDGAPHKIGTQLLIQRYPELIKEIAPVDIVTNLFGHYFTPQALKGTGPFQMFPALTTVPLFVAWKQENGSKNNNSTDDQNQPPTTDNDNNNINSQKAVLLPYTALHCEPIGNIAVQLSGKKKWTLVQPEHWYRLQPSLAPDGRAFFASWLSSSSSDYNNIPIYSGVITEAGDAMWVPTWTWHRVDYVASNEIAIGASLFHFRPLDYVANHPLFALLLIPALLKELVGYNTQ